MDPDHIPWNTVWVFMVFLILVSSFSVLLAKRYRTFHIAYDYRFGSTWTALIGDKVYHDVDLATFVTDHHLKRGEGVSFTTVIPGTTPLSSMIRMESSCTTVDVFVGGNRIYSYGDDNYKNGDFVGSGYHFIDLPDNSSGQRIQIVMVPTESGLVSSFYPVDIIPAEDAFVDFGSNHMIVGCLGIFLAEFGAIVMLLGLASLLGLKNSAQFFLIGAASFLLGLWTVCVTKTIELFSLNFTLNTELEHISLFLAPIPILLLIVENRKSGNQWRRGIAYFAVLILTVFDIVAVILHYTNVLHFPMILTCFHALVGLSALLVIVANLEKRKKMSAEYKIIGFGLAELLLCGIIEVVRYNMQRYLYGGNSDFSITVLPFGMTLFIVLVLIAYVYGHYRETLAQMERETWHRMAYTDALTGISNRARAEEELRRLRTGKKPFEIISIDLNNLKKTNDTYGHEAGDRLITTFSEMLNRRFEGADLVARMGGDEFLVIMGRENAKHSEERIAKMMKDAKNLSSELHYPLEFAYGIADASEAENQDPEEVFRIADHRMYEKKKTMKSARI